MTSLRADGSTSLSFTTRGEAALDELATLLAERCSGSPDGIAQILDEVMCCEVDDLTAALDAVAGGRDSRKWSRGRAAHKGV